MSNTIHPELSIVIVNHNCSSQLQQCLASLKENSVRISAEIIVIDNNSDDGAAAMLARSFPDVNLIQNHKNVGFSRANNQGIKASQSEYILFLNPDTIVYSGALDILMQVLREQKKIGGVGPALLHNDQKFQVSFGGRRNFCSEMFQKFILNPYYRIRLRYIKKQRKAVWLSAACLMVRKDVLDEVGGFDEDFFLYYEDIDLCFRINNTGRSLLFIPDARILHYGGISTRKQQLNSRFFYRQSQLYFYRKHNSLLSRHLLRIFLFLNFSWLYIGGIVYARKELAERKKYFTLLRRF